VEISAAPAWRRSGAGCSGGGTANALAHRCDRSADQDALRRLRERLGRFSRVAPDSTKRRPSRSTAPQASRRLVEAGPTPVEDRARRYSTQRRQPECDHRRSVETAVGAGLRLPVLDEQLRSAQRPFARRRRGHSARAELAVERGAQVTATSSDEMPIGPDDRHATVNTVSAVSVSEAAHAVSSRGRDRRRTVSRKRHRRVDRSSRGVPRGRRSRSSGSRARSPRVLEELEAARPGQDGAWSSGAQTPSVRDGSPARCGFATGSAAGHPTTVGRSTPPLRAGARSWPGARRAEQLSGTRRRRARGPVSALPQHRDRPAKAVRQFSPGQHAEIAS
jgi:hypothetical protein